MTIDLSGGDTKVTARWEGDKLLLTRNAGKIKFDQVISLEDGKLTISTQHHFEGYRPVVFVYARSK